MQRRQQPDKQQNPTRKSPTHQPTLPPHQLLRLQQRYGNRAVMRMLKKGASHIQRDVGFEFETNWRIFAFDQAQHGNTPLTGPEKGQPFMVQNGYRPAYLTDNLNKGMAIFQSDHFELQVDELESGGKDVEFVSTLPPFPETDTGRGDLDTAMTDLFNVTQAMVGSPHHKIEPNDLAALGAVLNPDVVIKKNTAGMTGSPQATVAIRLDQIPDLFETIGTPANAAPDPTKARGRRELSNVTNTGTGADQNAQVVGDAPGQALAAITTYANNIQNKFAFRQATRQANHTLANHIRGDANLKGFITLLVTYLVIGNSATQPRYAKQIAPLLARTNFSTMFHMLNPQVRAHFQANPNQFTRMVLGAAGLNGTESTPLLRVGISGGGGGNNPHILDRVTRKRWLAGITQGQDILTEAGFDARFGANQGGDEMESLGRLGGRTEWVGADRHGRNRTRAPIFEMRRMQGTIPHTQWRQLALDVFDYIRQVNRRNRGARF